MMCKDTNLSFDNGIAICAIYEDRPKECRDYPLDGACYDNRNLDM